MIKYIILTLMIVGCSPKFKVGDCIKETGTEDWQHYRIWKIVKVGQSHYLDCVSPDYQDCMTESFGFINNFYFKTECPK